MAALAAEWAPRWGAGDFVRLVGELGAGKTTFVRGLVHALGVQGEVRSPTFNLIQTFQTEPPIVHVDLYRVRSGLGLGLEDLLDDHLVLVEWAEHGADLWEGLPTWELRIEPADEGRKVSLNPPQGP